MFDEIKKDTNRKPLLTYVVAAISIIIGTLTFFSPDLSYSLFGSINGSVSIVKIFTLPFQHGFDKMSMMIHLGTMLFFWIVVGSFVEKVMGPERFTFMIVVAILMYGITIFVLGLPGHGLSPLIFSLFAPMIVIMLESVSLKLAHAYSEWFKLYRNLMVLFTILSLVLFSIVPIFFKFNSNSVAPTTSSVISKGVSADRPLERKGIKFTKKSIENSGSISDTSKGIVFGNLVNIICFFVGGYFGYSYKKRIGGTLTRFNRRKYLSDKSYKPIYIFTAAISGYLILVFILSLFIEI